MGALRQKCVANFYNFTATPSYSIHQYYNDFTKDPGMFIVCCFTLLIDIWVKDIRLKAKKLSWIFENAYDPKKIDFRAFISYIVNFIYIFVIPAKDMARYAII